MNKNCKLDWRRCKCPVGVRQLFFFPFLSITGWTDNQSCFRNPRLLGAAAKGG